jgi:hypothetical protein
MRYFKDKVTGVVREIDDSKPKTKLLIKKLQTAKHTTIDPETKKFLEKEKYEEVKGIDGKKAIELNKKAIKAGEAKTATSAKVEATTEKE